MGTVREIQDYTRTRLGWVAQSCWIAHVKELNGLPLRAAPNRQNLNIRLKPCPNDKRSGIEEAMRRFGML